MRNGEGKYFDVADSESFARVEVLAAIEMSLVVVLVQVGLPSRRSAHPALPLLMRVPSDVDRNLQSARQDSESGHMVLMLMRDNHRGELRRILARAQHAPQRFAAGDARVDEDAGARTGKYRSIAARSRSQHRHAHHRAKDSRKACG